jgi:hypothetical protein
MSGHLFSPPLFVSPFPLDALVAISGARRGSPVSPRPVVAAILGSGGRIRVDGGRGVSAIVRRAAVELPDAIAVVDSAELVREASALCLFPDSAGSLGAHGDQALDEALLSGIPVWIAGARPIGRSWQSLVLTGIPGFACFPTHSQMALFGAREVNP